MFCSKIVQPLYVYIVRGIDNVTDTPDLLYILVLKFHHLQLENQALGKCTVSPLGIILASSLLLFATP